MTEDVSFIYSSDSAVHCHGATTNGQCRSAVKLFMQMRPIINTTTRILMVEIIGSPFPKHGFLMDQILA
jgi:hypothetical protein